MTPGSLNVSTCQVRSLIQKVDPELESVLGVSFLHRDGLAEGFVVPTLSGKVLHIQESGDWTAEEVIKIPAKKVSGRELPELGGLVTDIQAVFSALIGRGPKMFYSDWSRWFI